MLVDYILGIILALTAAFMFSLGAILQKKAVDELPEITFDNIIGSLKVMIANRGWLIGTILATAGGIPYLLAQVFIGVAFSQPLMGLGILFLAIFATKWIGESLRLAEEVGIAILVIAPIFLSLGAVTNTAVSIYDPNFHLTLIIFYIISFSAIAVSFLIYWKSDKFVSENMALNSGIFFGAGAISAQLGVLASKPLISDPITFIIYPFFFEYRPEPDLVIGMLGIIILLIGNGVGTYVVQIAFQRGKAAIVGPIQSAGNLIIPIFGGVIIFRQIIGNIIMYIIGITLILIGAILLARIQAETQKKKS